MSNVKTRPLLREHSGALGSSLLGFDAKNVSIPVAVSVFPDELYPAPRSWAERAYPKLIHYNKLNKGGHFAAWEQPQLFSEEVRAGFRPLRKLWSRRDDCGVARRATRYIGANNRIRPGCGPTPTGNVNAPKTPRN
jgi:hypothetical protein